MPQNWSGTQLIGALKRAQGEQKDRVFTQLEALLGLDEGTIREMKYTNGLSCPLCHTKDKSLIVRNGRMAPGSDRQRYICKACGHTFNDYTGTILHRKKQQHKLPAYLQTMLDGLSIRESAKVVGISPTTAHAWRKKILELLERHAERFLHNLEGIVEVADRDVKPSRKGLKTVKDAPSYPKQKLLFLKDRQNQVFVHIGDRYPGKFPALENTSPHKGVIRAGNATPLKALSPADRSLYHCKNADLLKGEFDNMYRRMRGVAAPYLYQYALWQCCQHDLESRQPKQRLLALLQLCL